LIPEEVKGRQNSCHASYYSVQNLLPFHLLSKNVKAKNKKSKAIPVIGLGGV
jgi:hypothetical protein